MKNIIYILFIIMVASFRLPAFGGDFGSQNGNKSTLKTVKKNFTILLPDDFDGCQSESTEEFKKILISSKLIGNGEQSASFSFKVCTKNRIKFEVSLNVVEPAQRVFTFKMYTDPEVMTCGYMLDMLLLALDNNNPVFGEATVVRDKIEYKGCVGDILNLQFIKH